MSTKGFMTMMITTDSVRSVIDELLVGESGTGRVERLLSIDWPGELLVSVTKPDNFPALVLRFNSSHEVDLSQVPQSELAEFTVKDLSGGKREVSLELDDLKNLDIFSALIADISSKVIRTESEFDGIKMFTANLGRWIRSLKRRRHTLLSNNAQVGLFGEILALRDLLTPALGVGVATRGWVGPEGAYQDFQFGATAVEIKSLTVTQPQQLLVTSERQLDDTNFDHLFLAHVSLDTHEGGLNTLPELIDSMRTLIFDEGDASESFEDRLIDIGYFDVHAQFYSKTGYEVRCITIYEVENDFPRIRESDLSDGVGSVRYLIDASACKPFEVPIERMSSCLQNRD